MKAGKRARGSVFQRSQDGRWVVRITLPDSKRITRYALTKAEAEEKLAVLLVQAQQGEAVPVSELTLERWLSEYIERHSRGKSVSTYRNYKHQAGVISRGLGRHRLDKLTPQQVQTWADGLRLSARTNNKALQLLRSALDEAMALGHVSRNVALPVKLARQPAKKAGVSWTQDEARRFLAANESTSYHLLWKLGLQTGMRIGELLALRVGDYNAETATLRVQRSLKLSGEGQRRDVGATKTEASNRVVHLPPDAVVVVEAQLQRRELLAGGAGWRDEGWLFPSTVGTLQGYSNVRRAWLEALQRAAVPELRLHDMRVTFISLALRRGVKPEVVARMVGHTSPLITMRIYRQVFADELEDAAALVAELV